MDVFIDQERKCGDRRWLGMYTIYIALERENVKRTNYPCFAVYLWTPTTHSHKILPVSRVHIICLQSLPPLVMIRYRRSLHHKLCRLRMGGCHLTSSALYVKTKSLGSGGSMVARLKLKEIDGRAPPGKYSFVSVRVVSFYHFVKLWAHEHMKLTQTFSLFFQPSYRSGTCGLIWLNTGKLIRYVKTTQFIGFYSNPCSSSYHQKWCTI